MMHGHEKSDPSIVAVKPTNNSEQSVAELVEQRAGTKDLFCLTDGTLQPPPTCRINSSPLCLLQSRDSELE